MEVCTIFFLKKNVCETPYSLYGCASYFVHEFEGIEETENLRRLAHKFLKDTWSDLGQTNNYANMFPHEFIIAGEVNKVTLNSVSDWLQFLQTNHSIYMYSEFEVETQNLANLLNASIEVLNYNKEIAYMNTYHPQPEIAIRSPYFGSSSRTMLVYHEIDSHFEIVVDKA